MLAIFNGPPLVEPSPYAPMSRLHWNEMYVDPRATAEWKSCKAAKQLTGSTEFKNQLTVLSEPREVDYGAVAKLKRSILELLAEEFFTKKRERAKDYKGFLKLYPTADDFAAFRATGEFRNEVWSKWPELQRGGDLH